MRTVVYYALCTAGMIGFYYLVRFFITGISPDFGNGFFVGAVLAGALVFLGTHLEHKDMVKELLSYRREHERHQ